MSDRGDSHKDAVRRVGSLLEKAPVEPRERLVFLESALKGAILERQIQLLESYSLFYGQGTGSGSRFLGEDPRTDDGYEPWDEIGIGGQARRLQRSTRDYEIARDVGRALAAENEYAIGAHECRQSYVVGAGLVYSVVPLDEGAYELAQQAQRELEEFFTENDWPEMEQEAVLRGDRDGEAIFRLFPASDGPLRARFVEPEAVTAEGGAGNAPVFGIEHAPDDVRDVQAMWIRPAAGGPPQRVPVKDEATGLRLIEHVRLNVDASSPRGWPTMYPIRRNLARAEKLLRNMSYVAALQAAIALIRKHESATKTEVESYLDSERDLLVSNSATGRQTRYQQMGAGTVIDAGPGVSYEAPVSSVNAGNNVAVLQAELRAAAARLQMPEYMFSGDASNANYGSTLVAEAPAVKQFLRLQGKFGRVFQRIAWTALRHAAAFSRLPEGVLTRCQIKIGYPSVIVRDQLQEAQRRQIEYSSGVLSRRTWREQAGYDHDTEERNLDREGGDDEPGDEPPAQPDGAKPPPGSTDGGPGGVDQKSTGSMVAEERLTEHGDELASLRESLESERLRAVEAERSLAELGGRLSGLERAASAPQVAAQAPVINLTMPEIRVDARTTVAEGAVQSPVTIAAGAVHAPVDARTTISEGAVQVANQVEAAPAPSVTFEASLHMDKSGGAKRVTFERGPDGKPIGATVTPTE